MKKDWKIAESAGAGAKCDHFKLDVRTCVRAHLNLDVQGACVRPKKRSQLTPCILVCCIFGVKYLNGVNDFSFFFKLYRFN